MNPVLNHCDNKPSHFLFALPPAGHVHSTSHHLAAALQCVGTAANQDAVCNPRTPGPTTLSVAGPTPRGVEQKAEASGVA